jgi:hypothetical protein
MNLGIQGDLSQRDSYLFRCSYLYLYPAYAAVSLYDDNEWMIYSLIEYTRKRLFDQNLSLSAALACDFGSLDPSLGTSIKMTWEY